MMVGRAEIMAGLVVVSCEGRIDLSKSPKLHRRFYLASGSALCIGRADQKLLGEYKRALLNCLENGLINTRMLELK